MTDRELIDLIVERSRNDGNLSLNLAENTVWSKHFGWGFRLVNCYDKESLNVRIKTDGHLTDDDTILSLRLGYWDMRYAKREFNKLKKEIKEAKENARERDRDYEAKLSRGLLEEFIKDLGSGE